MEGGKACGGVDVEVRTEKRKLRAGTRPAADSEWGESRDTGHKALCPVSWLRRY
eukprot:COSAG02_NODE_37978_length_435_cov_0.645833_1_plen_53_part_01